MIHLRHPVESDPKPGVFHREAGESALAVPADEGGLRCRTCGIRIACRDDRIAVIGETPQVFVNPHGLVYELVTLRRAIHVVGIGRPTTEFTWFPGYAWQVVACARCAAHLGWEYRAIAGSSPPSFYGLIRSELITDDPAPRQTY